MQAARGAGVRVTPQRRAVFRFLASTGDHPDAEAEAVIGKCRESHQRDLCDAIGRGELLHAARNLFRLMSPAQQAVLFENTARAMGDAPEEIKVRHVANCRKADPAYGEGVARALGIPMNMVEKQPAAAT